MSVVKARQALQGAEVAVAIVDASAAIEHQDLAILGMISKGRIPAVVAAYKIDLLKSRGSLDMRLKEIGRALGFAAYIPVIPISARTGGDQSGAVPTESARGSGTVINRQTVRSDGVTPPSNRGAPSAIRACLLRPEAGSRFSVRGSRRSAR